MTPVQYGGQVRHRPNRATEYTGTTRDASPSRDQSRCKHVREGARVGVPVVVQNMTFSKSTYNSPTVIGWEHWTKDGEKKSDGGC
jgi:hypothetical protein